jgi:hypothetical protein
MSSPLVTARKLFDVFFSRSVWYICNNFCENILMSFLSKESVVERPTSGMVNGSNFDTLRPTIFSRPNF